MPVDEASAFDGLAAVQCGDVLIVLWKLPATSERFDWLEARLHEAARAHASFVVCQVILASSSPPNARLRARIREVMDGLRGKMRRVVSVALGDAVWMSVVRVVMRGLSILSGHGDASTIARTAREGLDHILAAAGPDTPDRDALEDALASAAAALGIDVADIGLR